MAKQTVKQRKALRSEAAKKGWATRIARERREMEERDVRSSAALTRLRAEMERTQNVAFQPSQASWADVSGIPDILRGAPPKPSLWQRIKGRFA